MTRITRLGCLAAVLVINVSGAGCGDGGGQLTDGGWTDATHPADGATPDDQGEPEDADVDAQADSHVVSDMGTILDPDMGVDFDLGGDIDIGAEVDMGASFDIGGSTDVGVCTGADADGDGVPNVCDRCALGADQLDADLDTVPDACDRCVGFSDLVDTDTDTVPDGCDICAGGADSADADGDGVPNACDSCPAGPNGQDTDGDGTPNACDVCAGHSDAADADDDGVPNGCDICSGHDDDVDTDMDGVPNGCDVCAGHDDDVDTDMDGFADGCDCEPEFSEGHPGLSEVCDGLDNDCSGGVDNGLAGCSFVCRPREVDWDLDGGECEAMGRVIYVDVDAVGDGDGTSWADAYVTIEDAILDAEATPSGSKQIWVAAGTYSPSRVVGTLIGGTIPITGFLMPANTALLGGFSGIELAAVDADPNASVTSLVVPGVVSRMFDVRQPGVRVDGFVVQTTEFAVVTGGALHASRVDVQGFFTPQLGYSVVKVVTGDVILEDANLHDGSIGIEAIGGTVLCNRCVITRNGLGATLGSPPSGGINIQGALVTLRNSAVVNNAAASGFQPSATGPAGGVVISAAAGQFRAENTTISGNNGSRKPTITTSAPAGLDVQRGTATLVNSIVQNNDGGNSISATVISSSVEGRAGACAPLFSDPATIPGIRLGAGSTCIDAGDTGMAQGPIDLAGAPRVRGVAVDLGAFEVQP